MWCCQAMQRLITTSTFPVTQGVFLPAMGLSLGLGASTLRRHRASGLYVPVSGRALAPRDVEITVEHRAIGALLTWPDGVVCLRTAACLLAWPVSDGGETDVLVPNGRRGFGGLVPHQWGVRPTEVIRVGGVRMTDRLTTLADCLGRLPEQEGWGLLAWLWTRDEITAADIESQIDDRYHLYGVVRLRAMLAAVLDGALSLGEVKFHEFLREGTFVGWQADQKVGREGRIVARVDVLIPDLGIVLEFDGAIAHNDATAAKDAHRDRALRNELGLLVEHVTWGDMYERPRHTVLRIRAAIELAGAQIAAGVRPYPFLHIDREKIWARADPR